jgi:hypothetical protein
VRVIKSAVYSSVALFLIIHPGYSAPLSDEQLIRQQESQRAREAQLMPPAPEVRLSPQTVTSGIVDFPDETPCFPIQRVELQQRETLPHWLPLQKLADRAVGHCLGGKGINALMGLLQNRLINHGYVTTRILAPKQNLNSGQLVLVILPGTIRYVKLTPQSGHYVSLLNSFPPKSDGLLNLRDIEQGLENLQRVPTAQASMEIIPGEQPGESDILLDWKQSRMWRLGVSLDDSGSRSTGRYQGGVTLYVDNPLSLSDTFYFNAGKSLQPHGEKGTHSYTHLKGGLITSNNAAELAGLNQFSTGTLTSSDIKNRSEFEGKGIGLSGSYSKVNNGEGGNTSGKPLVSKDLSQGIGYDHGSDSSKTRSGINTDNIAITDPDAQQALTGKDVSRAIADIKTDISTETAAAHSGKLDNNFNKDDVFKELNLQVNVTKEFQGNARSQINSYIDGKQAVARADLKNAMASNDAVARD